MKITSLTLQAFRGFNKKEEFSLEADIIILYGPNGHGKSSIYDAIEWGLTGGIHRFNDASPERKRTRFIKNLHADIEDRSFVMLGIIFSNDRRFIIERECTASVSDRSDYGIYKLRIFDENDQLYKEDEEAEETLKKWLIHEEWLSGISSPTTMLSLTHILSQEKMGEFLRGMQERDRYDAISTIFGTDYFDKYREGFRAVKNKLNKELTYLKSHVIEKNLNKDKLQSDVEKLEMKVVENEDTDFDDELESYISIYPEIKLYKDDLGKVLKSIITNQQILEIDRKEAQTEYYLLKEIKEEFPNIVYMQKVREAVLYEQNVLQRFKKITLSKMKIENLISMEEFVKDDKDKLELLSRSQRDSNLKINSLSKEKENLLMILEPINITFETFSWRNGLGFSSEINTKLAEEDYEIINNSFMCMFNEYKIIKQNEYKQHIDLIELRALDESIKQIESTDELYSVFLSSLNKYILDVSEELKNCPACGTKDIEKEDILKNIDKQQLKVNKNLPRLKELYLQMESNLKEIEREVNSANTRIEEYKKSVEEVLCRINNDIKIIDITTSTERKKQTSLQEEIDLLKLKLNQFENDCALLSLKIEDNIKEKLGLKKQELLNELNEIDLTRRLNLEPEIYLPEKLRLKKYDISQMEEHEQDLQQIILLQELEIERVNRLIKISGIINVDIKNDDLEKVKINMSEEIQKLNQRLKKISSIEKKNINLQILIEFNTERMRLIQLQKELTDIEIHVDKLEKMEIKMNNDIIYLSQLIDKSPKAVSNLNAKVFSKLKETIQKVFEQINSHPTFTKLDLEMDTYRNNNYLTINVSKVNGTNEVKANAPYVFSSAQVNSIALSLFLAMSLKQKWSPLQLIGLDDPIQSMDEVNVISFIDLLRLFIDKQKKQIIISTHDYSFYKMILKKFRYHNLAVIEFEAYDDNGPKIKKHGEDIHYSKVKMNSNYEQIREALLRLDTSE